jgi:signal transduction histidine kinase
LSQQLAIVVALIVIGVTLLLLYEWNAIEREQQRANDESAEEGVAIQAYLEFRTVFAGLQLPAPDRVSSAAVRAALTRSQSTLVQFHSIADSNPNEATEHERREVQVLEELQAALAMLDAQLASAESQSVSTESSPLLARIDRLFAQLIRETRFETAEARTESARSRASVDLAMIALCALGLLLVASAWWIVHSRIARPLANLRAAVERFGDSGRAQPLDETRTDELGELARAFNRMAERLQHSQAQVAALLETRTREYKRAAKLADLGTFAAGIAHEINTPLASVGASAEGLLRRVQSGALNAAEATRYLETISQETQRTATLAQRLLDLARHDREPARTVQVGQVAHGVAQLLEQRARARSIQLTISEPHGACPELQLPRGDIEQVILNLVTNAIDASPPGSRIELELSHRNELLRVAVLDRGAGIPPELREQVFEPFYTTKGAGEGTGLGLAIVALIVEELGGRIVIGDREQGGASIEVFLPTSSVGEGR